MQKSTDHTQVCKRFPAESKQSRVFRRLTSFLFSLAKIWAQESKILTQALYVYAAQVRTVFIILRKLCIMYTVLHMWRLNVLPCGISSRKKLCCSMDILIYKSRCNSTSAVTMHPNKPNIIEFIYFPLYMWHLLICSVNYYIYRHLLKKIQAKCLRVTSGLPSTGATHSVEESYECVLDPFLEELEAKGAEFPKTIIYLPLRWCGHMHHHALK